MYCFMIYRSSQHSPWDHSLSLQNVEVNVTAKLIRRWVSNTYKPPWHCTSVAKLLQLIHNSCYKILSKFLLLKGYVFCGVRSILFNVFFCCLCVQLVLDMCSLGWGMAASVCIAVYCFVTCITFIIIIGDQFDRG